MTKTRDECYALLTKYNQSESLLHHALHVEGVMRYFAAQYGDDADFWGCVGLLHDLDYEQYPEQHCAKSEEILVAEGFEPDFVRAVVSHGWGICSDVEPQSDCEKVLYTIDELTGLLTACAYMRPSKSVSDLEWSSVKKKFKDKKFAAGVNREVVLKGCDMLGRELEDVVTDTILGMRTVWDNTMGTNA